MAGIDKQKPSFDLRKFFPLKDIASVVALFTDQFQSCDPNLAVLSLVCGFIEHRLTDKSGLKADFFQGAFPVLEFDEFDQLYQKYLNLIDSKVGKNSKHVNVDIDGSALKRESFSSREEVKEIADFVWSQLSTSYFKDRPHIQNVYSFLNGKRLDCFGVALLVVTTAQQVGRNDIHLVLSEDHAWVSFGKDSVQSAEVTWHGKRDGIKRGNPICQDSLVDFSKDWLYLGGNGMQCDRFMEAAAIVSAINPGINAKTDSEILGRLQQDLLWLLFDHGHLDRYPMAVCNLADLEEIEESHRVPSIKALHEKAIRTAEIEYSGFHVYPYTYYGGYLYRKGQFAEAARYWKDAANAASRYTHSREDEELYKDLHEIANTFFPAIAKLFTKKTANVNDDTFEEDFFDCEENLINILKFYDGVCLWEEGGSTSAIHSEWAKNFSKLMNCFAHERRANVLERFVKIVPDADSVEERAEMLLRSKKMSLIQNVLCHEKINNQLINLHLTLELGLIAVIKSDSKRTNDLLYSDEAGKYSRNTKRHKP